MKINNKLKKHFKEGIITLAIAGITGLFAVANAQIENYKETQAYYTESECVVLTADELNNIALDEVADYLVDYDLNNTYIIYNNKTYNFTSKNSEHIIYWYNRTGDDLYFNFENDIVDKGKFQNSSDEEITFTTSIYWYGTDIVNAFKESTITLTPTQLNDTTYSYLSEQIEDDYTNQLVNSVIEYNDNIYTFDEFIDNELYWSAENTNIVYECATNKFRYNDNTGSETITSPFTDSITIFNASYIVDNINAPFETGDIIPAISGGLTLIGDLANEFLTGFSTLFWDSVGNKLTNFGIYSLTMLGVAITFAVIKLCLSVLRRDTGA